jgi:hypothetical protein
VELPGSPRLPLEITTTVEGAPVSLPLALQAGRTSLGRVSTDGLGRAKIRLPTADLGGPGIVTVRARFAGDDRLNPASAQADTLVVSSVQLVLGTDTQTVGADDELVLRGSISDAKGGIAGATIHLEAMGKHAASARSDPAGAFSFKLFAEDYPPGRLDLVARFTPDVIWRRTASSNPVKVEILPPKPIPVRLYVIPAVITALIMIGLLLVRFGAAIKTRLTTEDKPREAHTAQSLAPVASGARFSRTGLRGLIKQASDVHGMVWDPVDSQPIVGAQIQIQGPGGFLLELTSDTAGRFHVPGLAAGGHRFTVRCRGYISETFLAQIPHRGSLHGVRVDLVQVRVRVLEIYREVAVPLLPERELWACWTPRQLARHVGVKAGQRQWHLGRLTGLVEEVYWSGEPPEESIVHEALRLREPLRKQQ